jgi:hydrogenase/urease accessory protein HupE
VSVVGDDALDPASVVPKPLAFVMVGFVAVLLGLMAFPALEPSIDTSALALSISLWQNRVLDVWIQIALIFSGVMGVLGLLSEKTPGRLEEIQK